MADIATEAPASTLSQRDALELATDAMASLLDTCGEVCTHKATREDPAEFALTHEAWAERSMRDALRAARAAQDAGALGADVTAELRDRIMAIRALLGPSSYVTAGLNVSSYSTMEPNVFVYPEGVTGTSKCETFSAPTLADALTAAEAWAATYEPIRIDAIIRKLALDILDLTDQHGSVTVAMLRGRGHSGDDISAHKDAACIRAGEMGGNAPFEVLA